MAISIDPALSVMVARKRPKAAPESPVMCCNWSSPAGELLPIVDNLAIIVNNMKASATSPDTKHGHLREAARARIEQLVLTGVIAAGERANEMKLAAQFNMSRGPVREALRALEHAGLLVAIPNRGVFVKKVDLADALNLYEVRAGLARVTGRLVAQRASKEQIAALRSTYAKMQRAGAARDMAGFYSINLHFHAQLIRFAGNPRLAAMSEAVRNEMQLYLRDAVLGPAQSKQSQAEHRAILDAVVAGDAQRAGAAFEAHILAGKQRMLEYMGSRVAANSPPRRAS